MQLFKLGFRNKSVFDQLTLCERIVKNLADHPESQPDGFAKTQSVVTDFRSSHDRVTQLRAQLKAEISKRNQLAKTARQRVSGTCMGAYGKLNFNPAKLMEIGLELEKSKAVRVGIPAAPTNLRVQATDSEGEARLKLKRPLRRCWFEVQSTTDIQKDNWKTLETFFRQTHTIKNLKSGALHWLRVRAINPNGESPWSNPVAVRVK